MTSEASATDAQPARITITRRDAADVRQRQIVTSLDGEPLGTLLFGEVVTREITPGTHRLRAHNTLFWKTREFAVGPGEHARFKVVNRAGLGSFSLLGLFGAAPLYLTLEPEGPPHESQR